MTSYFDGFATRVSKLSKDDAMALADGLHDLELEIVRDVTIVAEMPGCPPQIRDAIHRCILRYGVESIPQGAPPADFETWEDHRRRILDLGGSLHDVFHDLGSLRLPGFSDSPYTPTRRIEGQGDAYRQKLAGLPYEESELTWADCVLKPGAN